MRGRRRCQLERLLLDFLDIRGRQRNITFPWRVLRRWHAVSRLLLRQQTILYLQNPLDKDEMRRIKPRSSPQIEYEYHEPIPFAPILAIHVKVKSLIQLFAV